MKFIKLLFLSAIILCTSCSQDESEGDINTDFSFLESFESTMPVIKDYHEILKLNSLDIRRSSEILFEETMSTFELRSQINLSYDIDKMIDPQNAVEIANFVNTENSFTPIEVSIYGDAISSIENVELFDYKDHYSKLNDYIRSNTFSKETRDRLLLMKETFELAIMIDPSSSKDLLKDDGESIIKSSIVTGLFGAVSGLWSGCKTGLVLGFNPGSVAAGCMGGLIVGTISGMITGAAAGAAACVVF